MYEIMTWCVIYSFIDKLYTEWNDANGPYWDAILLDGDNNPIKNLCKNYSVDGTAELVNSDPIFKTKEIIWK